MVAFSLEAREYGFTFPGQASSGLVKGGPNIQVKAGDRVKLGVVNQGVVAHNLLIADYGPEASTAVLEPGQQQTLEFVAGKSGAFRYICTQSQGGPPHSAIGMEGSFVVQP